MPLKDIGAILAGSPSQIGGNKIETSVARAYLVHHVNEFDRVDFNVGLGPGVVLGSWADPSTQAAATYSSKPRADMIAWRGDVPYIIEVKDRINPSVMGQLLTYWHIMREENPKLLNVYKIVAGRSVQEGLPVIFARYNIGIELYPQAVQAYPVLT